MHDPFPAPAALDGPQRVVVLRAPVSPGWLRALPAAPDGTTVSVSLTEPSSALRDRARLRDLGYVPLGAVRGERNGDWADFGLPAEGIARHRDWATDVLAATGGRLLDPALGPARLALGRVVDAHAEVTAGDRERPRDPVGPPPASQ